MGQAAIRFNAESVFDVLAVMIKQYKTIAPEMYNSPERRRATQLIAEQELALKSLYEANPELGEPVKLLITGFPQNLRKNIEGWKYYSDPDMLLELITRFEGKLYLDDVLRTIRSGPFQALNGNYEQTGIRILPNVRSVHDPRMRSEVDGAEQKQKHWAWEYNPGINQELRNIFYVENADLVVRGVPCKLNNVVIDSVFFDGKKQITIAASPMANDITFKMCFHTRNRDSAEEHRFTVKGLHNPEKAWRRVEASFLQACRNQADIVMFPEMLGDEAFFRLEEKHTNRIDDLIDKAIKMGLSLPLLILMPTWWHDGHNELHVFSEKNEFECIQQKFVPFIFRKTDTNLEYVEDLMNVAPEVQLVHINGIGRVAFMICRDMLEENYGRVLISTLHSTLILCPSFSPHKTAFDLKDGAGRPNGCYIVWLNTCSASEADIEHVGWIARPINEEYVTRFCPECGGYCGEDSDACLFLTQIGIGLENSDEIAFRHIHPNP